jgi:hypothetical protein
LDDKIVLISPEIIVNLIIVFPDLLGVLIEEIFLLVFFLPENAGLETTENEILENSVDKDHSEEDRQGPTCLHSLKDDVEIRRLGFTAQGILGVMHLQ